MIKINQILGLKDYISDIESGINDLNSDDYIRNSGGYLNGTLNISGNLILQSGIYVSGNFFKLNLFNSNENLIEVGDINNYGNTGSLIKLYSLYGEGGEVNKNGSILISGSGDSASLYLGDSKKIDFSDNLDIYSNNKFYIHNTDLNSILLESGNTYFNKEINLNKIQKREVKLILNNQFSSEELLDSVETGTFYYKSYDLYLYTRDEASIKNVKLIQENTGILLQQETSQNYTGLNEIEFKLYYDINFVYLKIVNNTNEIVDVIGNSIGYLK